MYNAGVWAVAGWRAGSGLLLALVAPALLLLALAPWRRQGAAYPRSRPGL